MTTEVEPDESTRTSKQLAATYLMASGTMVSRLLGFVRAMMIAIVMGNGTRQVEMFSLANTVPNMIYTLLAGGVLNTVFVPQIVRAIKKDSDGGEAYINRVLTATLAILAVITLVVTLAAPLIVSVYVDEFWKAPEQAPYFDNIVLLAYLCLPQLFFYGANVLIGQVLNSREKFGPMMWSPIANNIISIAVFGLYLAVWGSGADPSQPFTTSQVLLLGIGSTVGIIAQAAVLVPYLYAGDQKYKPRFDWRGVGLGHTARLARWTLGFVIVTQLGMLVITRLASSATVDGSGAGFNAYNQAMLIWILPHSLLTVSLTTAMLTSASERAARDDMAGVAAEAMRTMRIAMSILLPAAVAFLALGLPLTQLLFGNGQGAADARYLGWTLMALAVGLVPFTLNYVVQRTFYALEDTRTPFLQQIIITGLNVAFALVLVVPFHSPAWVAPALGLSYSMAYAIGFGINFAWLRRRLPRLAPALLFRLAVRCLVAVLPGAMLAGVVVTLMATDVSQVVRAGLLGFCGVVAVVMYLGFSRLLHIEEVTGLISTLRRRRTSPAAPETEKVDPVDGVDGVAGIDDDDTAVRPAGAATVAAAGPISTIGITAAVQAGDQTSQGGSTVETERGATHSLADDPDATAIRPPQSPDEVDDTSPEPGHSSPEPVEGPGDSYPQPVEGPPVPTERRGTVLGGRYRLEDQMDHVGNVVTWRAFDSVLSRSVVIHLLAPGDPRSSEILASARKAATATDSRFLRILDAVQSLDADHGSYVVCEYSPGQNLTQLLAHGPLSALEAAWVVREVADAIAGVHGSGLHHLRIGPDSIWITPTGNVKIGDLAIRAQFRATPDPSGVSPRRGRTSFHPETEEAHDVADLGRVLYACLVHRWPGGHRYGLEAAPTTGDGWLTPRQVRHGVSPALDRICDQILSEIPRQGEPIRTAAELVHALTRILGAADASADLERRLQQPVPPVPSETGEPVVTTESPLSTYWAQAVREDHGPDAMGSAAAANGSAVEPEDEEESRGPRRWMVGAIVLLLAILLVAIIAVMVQLRGQSGTDPTPSTSVSATTRESTPPVKLEIVDGTDFDPQGGDQTENPDRVPQAWDGDPTTGWTTDHYIGSPEFGGLGKDGVGMIVDLGSPKAVSQLEMVMAVTGANLMVMVPDDDPGSLDAPPKGSMDQWREIARVDDVDETVSITLDEAQTTRFVLIVFTKLGPDGDRFRAGLNEIEVYG